MRPEARGDRHDRFVIGRDEAMALLSGTRRADERYLNVDITVSSNRGG